jgi:hypothetical protein
LLKQTTLSPSKIIKPLIAQNNQSLVGNKIGTRSMNMDCEKKFFKKIYQEK